jgi:ribosomal protein S18 acetylase RimI-like enzyme
MIALSESLLDRPVWHALTGEQAHLAVSEGPARRFLPEIGPLAAAPDASRESLAALAVLARRTGPIATLQRECDPVPPGLRVVRRAEGVQMVYAGAPGKGADPRVVPLGAEHNAEMIALAHLTEPGPFAARTRELGRFWGMFVDGRLAAMAGQRTRFAGHVEVSAVCTHPDFRGRGLAAVLTRHCAEAVLAEGRTPFLQAYAQNTAALEVYRRIGFAERARIWITIFAAD